MMMSISTSDVPHIPSIESNAGHKRAKTPCLTPFPHVPRGMHRRDYSELPGLAAARFVHNPD